MEGLGIYPVRGREFVNLHPEKVFNAPSLVNGKTVEGKWTRALLDPQTRQVLDGLTDMASVRRFDEVAEVDVGIITGANQVLSCRGRNGSRVWLRGMDTPDVRAQ